MRGSILILPKALQLLSISLLVGCLVARAQSPDNPESPMSAEELDAWTETLGKPGPEHDVLGLLVGSWKGTVRVWADANQPPDRAAFELERKWILGGRYIQEEYSIETGEDPFRGVGLIGYNVAEGIYEVLWLDNQSTTHYLETGYYNSKTKVLTTRGNERDPATGFQLFRRSELSLADPDRHTMIGYSTDETGEQFKAIEIVFVRKE